MSHSLAEWLFSSVCHQQAARAWAPGSVSLALCQRCTGVYAGAALFACLLPLMRFRPSRPLALLHAAFILQILLLGTHLIPHGPSIRTISGQLFITGAGYFVWNNLRFRVARFRGERSPAGYLLGVLGTVAVLQALVRAPLAPAATLVELLALAGVAAIVLAALFTAGDLAVRACRGRPAAPLP